MPILDLIFYKKNIFFYDERKDLKIKTARLYKCKYINEINPKTLKKNKIEICVLCFDRSKSYYYSKKILNVGINLFAEKPVCSSSKELKELLSIAKKKNILFQSSFQRRFDKNLTDLKNKIDKKKNNIFKIKCSFYSGNFRFNKKTKIRTQEKIHQKINILNKDKISFLIFLNRYWHIVNAINFMFPFTKKINNIKNIVFNMYDRTNYLLRFTYKKNLFILIMNSNKQTGWKEKYKFAFKQKKYISELKAPMKFNSKMLNKTSFFSQIQNFLKKINVIDYQIIENCIEELKFIEKIWKKKYIS